MAAALVLQHAAVMAITLQIHYSFLSEKLTGLDHPPNPNDPTDSAVGYVAGSRK
jgi:hypothetical protein